WERHSQSAKTQALRMRCAAQQGYDLHALLEHLSLPPESEAEIPNTEAQLPRLLHAVGQLPTPEQCSAARLFHARPELPELDEHPEKRELADRVRKPLSQVRIRRALAARRSAQARLAEASRLVAAESADATLLAETKLEQGLVWLELEGNAEQA